MSFNWLLVRGASADPLSLKFAALQNKQNIAENEIFKPERARPKIISKYTDDTVLAQDPFSFSQLNYINTHYYGPFEPDGVKLKYWCQFNHIAKRIRDRSFSNNVTIPIGNPKLCAGPSDGVKGGTIVTRINSTLSVGKYRSAPYKTFPADGSEALQIPYSATYDLNQFSMSCWFRTSYDYNTPRQTPPDPDGVEGMLIIKGNWVGGTDQVNYGMWITDANHLRGGFEESDGTDHIVINSHTSDPEDILVNDGLWHHGCITYDGIEVVLYLDGVEVDQHTTSAIPDISTTDLYIGRNAAQDPIETQYFIGDLDEVRVYNRALTVAEISNIYNNIIIPSNGIVYVNKFGTDATIDYLYTPDAPGIRVSDVTIGFSVYTVFSFDSLDSNGGLDATIHFKVDNTGGTDGWMLKVSGNGSLIWAVRRGSTTRYFVSAQNKITTGRFITVCLTYNMIDNVMTMRINNEVQTNVGTDTATFPTGHRLDLFHGIGTNQDSGKMMGVLADCRWYNNLIFTDAEQDNIWINKRTISRRVESSWFDGVSDFIDVPDSPSLDLNQFSVAAWFRTSKDYHAPTDSPTGEEGIIALKGVWGANEHVNYGIWVTDANGLRGGFMDASGIEHIAKSTDSGLPGALVNDGLWHLGTVTYDGTIVKIYVDAVLHDTRTTSTTPETLSTQLRIGANTFEGHESEATGMHMYFQGQIREVGVWNRALTPTEITNHNTSGTIPTGSVYLNRFNLSKDAIPYGNVSVAGNARFNSNVYTAGYDSTGFDSTGFTTV